MKYEELSEEARAELAEEIATSDYFFGEIYTELSMHIQQIMVERGLIGLEEGDGLGPDCVEASDPILNGIFERYLNPPTEGIRSTRRDLDR